jgi:N-formylmaleamate deformylase
MTVHNLGINLMWQSEYIEANGIKRHYTRTGGAKPPMILLHGITDLGLCWTSVAEVLESDYDVIMVDFRGHGLSDAPETGYDLTTSAQDIYGIIQVLDLQKPVIFGHSLGAIAALAFAGLYPDIPKAILLEDPGPWWMPFTDTPEALAERAQGMRDSIISNKSKTREQLLEENHQEVSHWSETEQRYWAESKHHTSPNVANWFKPSIETRLDWSSLLSNITFPALLITGDPEKGVLTTPAAADQLQEGYVPHLQIEHIAGAGHCIHRDQFADCMNVVQSFLNQI